MERNNDIFEFDVLKGLKGLNLTEEDQKRKIMVQERFNDFLVCLMGR